MNRLEPKLVTVLREGYDRAQLVKDVLAGLIVGVVALPLAIAFAIASGVKPEQGLYTAIVAGFLISLLSGSRVQIGGPTGAFIVLVYGIVQKSGYEGLAVATIMAGAMLVAMGVAGLGVVIQFIPYPVTLGFTAGIAVIIATGQIGDALGLRLAEQPAEFIAKWKAIVAAIPTANPWAIGLTAGTVLVVLLLPRLIPRIPGSLVALVLATLAVWYFQVPVDTIGSRFGAVPSTLPVPRVPHIDGSMLREMFSPALSLALLAGIESLLSAVIGDGMTGRRHRPNMELVAQGVANLVSPLFLGIPATGAIARTATNVRSGGRTPIAGIVHAITLLVILLAGGRLAALIPMPVLAGILLVVAWNMGDAHLLVGVMKTTRGDAAVFATTFLLTVFLDLTVAIQVGVVLATFLFMRRMAEVTQVRALTGLHDDDEKNPDRAAAGLDPDGVEVFEIDGPLFFGAANKFKQTLHTIQRRPRVIVIHVQRLLTLDASGLQVLEEMQRDKERGGPVLVLSGVHAQPLLVMQRSGFLDRVGEENFAPDLVQALERARVAAASGR